LKLDQTQEKLFKIIVEILGKRQHGEIRLESNLVEDLGFDSMMAIRMMMEFETTFGINIIEQSDHINLADIKTVGDVLDLVGRFSVA
jgi:acyl carrier protein